MVLSRCNAFSALICLLAVAAYAFLRSQEGRIPASTRVDSRGVAWFRECAQWDPLDQRFLVSFVGGGLGQLNIAEPGAGIAEEQLLVRDADLKGNATLGFKLDAARNRVLAAVADVFGNRYSALAAYDTRSWNRIFLTPLAGPERLSLADDVAFDPEGNAYVTDAVGALIWKVSSDGSEATVLTSDPSFKIKPKPTSMEPSLNGIVYHPDGYLVVSHTKGNALFRVSLDGKSVRRVEGDEVPSGDGITLVRPDQLAVAGLFKGVMLVESKDGWLSCKVTHHYAPPIHRLPTAVTVKGDSVFVSYMNGYGIPYTSTIGEAAFTPLPIVA